MGACSSSAAAAEITTSRTETKAVIHVLVNGFEKFINEEWLVGSGRAAGTGLATVLLPGTDQEGLQESSRELTLPEDLSSAFDMLLFWLQQGDESLCSVLTESNSSKLYALAQHYGMSDLMRVIDEEENRWIQEPQAPRVPSVISVKTFRRINENDKKVLSQMPHTSFSDILCSCSQGDDESDQSKKFGLYQKYCRWKEKRDLSRLASKEKRELSRLAWQQDLTLRDGRLMLSDRTMKIVLVSPPKVRAKKAAGRVETNDESGHTLLED